MANFWGHLRTVTRHKLMVFRHCVKAGIIWRGLWHDMSKYSPAEFWVGVKYYQGSRSPNEGERDAYGYSKAWMHHKGRNKHHFEYWTDYNRKTKRLEPVKIPMVYVKEMFCDRVGASKIYRGEKYTENDPIDYYRHGNGSRPNSMHPETAKLLEGWLIMLANEGEEATFRHIRELKDY